MDIDWFLFELQYNSFPVNPINLKPSGYVHTVEVNICTKFEVNWSRFYFTSNLGLLANL